MICTAVVFLLVGSLSLMICETASPGRPNMGGGRLHTRDIILGQSADFHKDIDVDMTKARRSVDFLKGTQAKIARPVGGGNENSGSRRH